MHPRRQCDANDRAALIPMDYPNRWRLKIYAHAELETSPNSTIGRASCRRIFSPRILLRQCTPLRAVPLLWTSNSFFSSDDR